MKNRRQYSLSWIALGLLIFSVTCLLLFIGTDFGNQSLRLAISIVSWLLSLASGTYLFINSTKWAILSRQSETQSDDKGNASLKEKKAPIRNEQDYFDIQAIAKKIVRRVSADQKPEKWGKQLLDYFVSEIEIMSGIIYFKNTDNIFKSVATYSHPLSVEPYSFAEGEGITGQAAKNRQAVVFRSIPEDYANLFSGLGTGKPSYLAIVPLVIDDEPFAVIELAGFRWAEENLEQLLQIIARDFAQKVQDSKSEPGKTGSNDSLTKNSGEEAND